MQVYININTTISTYILYVYEISEPLGNFILYVFINLIEYKKTCHKQLKNALIFSKHACCEMIMLILIFFTCLAIDAQE